MSALTRRNHLMAGTRNCGRQRDAAVGAFQMPVPLRILRNRTTSDRETAQKGE
jgi:hypothetical protein